MTATLTDGALWSARWVLAHPTTAGWLLIVAVLLLVGAGVDIVLWCTGRLQRVEPTRRKGRIGKCGDDMPADQPGPVRNRPDAGRGSR